MNRARTASLVGVGALTVLLAVPSTALASDSTKVTVTAGSSSSTGVIIHGGDNSGISGAAVVAEPGHTATGRIANPKHNRCFVWVPAHTKAKVRFLIPILPDPKKTITNSSGHGADIEYEHGDDCRIKVKVVIL